MVHATINSKEVRTSDVSPVLLHQDGRKTYFMENSPLEPENHTDWKEHHLKPTSSSRFHLSFRGCKSEAPENWRLKSIEFPFVSGGNGCFRGFLFEFLSQIRLEGVNKSVVKLPSWGTFHTFFSKRRSIFGEKSGQLQIQFVSKRLWNNKSNVDVALIGLNN